MPAKGAAKRKASEVLVKVPVQEVVEEKAEASKVAPAETKAQDPATSKFLDLLQQAPESKADCFTWFQACADALLNNFEVVVAGNKIFRFVEIEFYYNDHKNHQDTFIHGSPLQLKTAGYWYFHTTSPTSTSFKAGSYKGLDLTFGKSDKYPGGILLRAMEEISSGTGNLVIEGPCLVVDRLLKENQKESIMDLVKSGLPLCATEVNPFMYIRPASKPAGRDVVCSARVGLTLKRHDANKETFIMMPYRMTSLTSKIKKNKQSILLALLAQGKSEEDVAKIAGTKLSAVKVIAQQLREAAATKQEPSEWKTVALNTQTTVGLFAACQRAGNV